MSSMFTAMMSPVCGIYMVSLLRRGAVWRGCWPGRRLARRRSVGGGETAARRRQRAASTPAVPAGCVRLPRSCRHTGGGAAALCARLRGIQQRQDRVAGDEGVLRDETRRRACVS